jgi:hypothetical protein
VERATVAVVAEEGGAVVAFLAVTARAPMPDTSGADGHHDASARLAWAKRTALELTSPGGTRFECGSTLWLAACATAPALQVSARAVLRRMLRECFARAALAVLRGPKRGRTNAHRKPHREARHEHRRYDHR